MQQYSSSGREMVASLWRNRSLILALTKREVIGRYRGSVMGLAWSFFNPILMLTIYTFIFSVVFNARWGGSASGSKTEFALILFVGLIVHGLFAECVLRAPSLILNNVNYVKKVIFPLEVLPWVAFGAALFHTCISLLVLLVARILLQHELPWTAVLFPLLLIPLVLGTLGVSWFLSALGVYVRDIGQITSMLTTVLLFMSPVFYPLSALPEKYRMLVNLNPLAYLIEESRNLLIFGVLPDLKHWAILMVISAVIAWLGFFWFQKTRKGFADVL
ncbi:Teichoic acid translocation permease protein TagG [Achromobacter deleyi]|uniref:Transport permease protein n=1 Tax=Achromobacter deleyi TaxID=1353891 RepID=A0A6S6ZK68_9BURK|nr:ABC transporter permease [Achromobacter deleyi]CAB3678421.1 Teichoic acid translocation permease protein TagG [Achromobacter deleyi]CAB3834130.1 Teichoic acid translocation permease protein TagG [Achromobacter deleyi]CAB3865255.1 Teichoic acid translocation permease protein TagG [Achromobacter deleyi]